MPSDIAMIGLGDSGLDLSKPSVALNDLRAIKSSIECGANLSVEIFDRKNIQSSKKCKMLFVHYMGIINYGGVQSKQAISAINTINSFDGPVIFFENDVLDGINNTERPGFMTITRPVNYADPSGTCDFTKNKNLDVLKQIEVNQSWPIGRMLASKEPVKTIPSFKAVYGGRNRKSMIKILQKISSQYPMLAYDNVAKSLPKATVLNKKCNFTNDELRVLNSFGQYSFIFAEKKKNYFTSRVFEQLASNSICLFDKSFSALSILFRDWNTFGCDNELMTRVEKDWSSDLIEKQHEMLSSFDFDYIEKQQAVKIAEVLGG